MKFGAQMLRVMPNRWVKVAQTAEKAGFESVWLPEHLVFPKEIKSRFLMSPDGVPPIRPHVPILDPLIVLSAIGATTSKIKLGTGVYLLPLRHPLSTARLAGTVDVLSGGRMLLGVAIGWMKEEFDAVGVDFLNRAARTEEGVLAIRELWTSPSPQFHGKYFSFKDIYFEPKPVQKPHPPILMGGEAPAAVRRAAKIGDGWFGSTHTAESARDRVRLLRQLRKELQVDHLPFEVTVSASMPFPTVDETKRYQDAGVDRLIIHVAGFSQQKKGVFDDAADAAMMRYGESVMAKA